MAFHPCNPKILLENLDYNPRPLDDSLKSGQAWSVVTEGAMRTGFISLFLLGFVAAPILRAAEDEWRVGEPSEAVRGALKLDPFYRKCVVVDGLAVVGSGKASDYALLEAAYLVDRMLAGRRDLRQALVKNKIRVAVMAPTEFTTALPEHSDLRPAAYWNKRARGLGATRARPAVSCGEENLLQYPGDPYQGENMLVHEFGHAVHEIAMKEVDEKFDGLLASAYERAMRDGLWKGTYAATNRSEYWAEGVQSWFDCNQVANNQHNGINTRAKLQEYDPRLAKLLAEVFRGNEWRYVAPLSRKEAGHLAGFDHGKAPRFSWPAELLKAYQEIEASKKDLESVPKKKE
jgi:hypothetical protein